MAKRLKDIEKERAAEERQAAAWLGKQEAFTGSMPGRRLENGESADRQRSAWLSGEDQMRGGVEDEPGTSRSITSIDQYDTVDEWEQAQLPRTRTRTHEEVEDSEAPPEHEEGGRKPGVRYLPLIGRSDTITPEQIAKRAMVAHVLGFLLPDHQELLRMRYAEAMTLDAMAAEFCVSYQAVQSRLATAEQDFMREFGKHALDVDVDWREGV